MTLIKTDKTQRRFSRRALLASLGASAAFLPLVNAERAQAAGAGGSPKRLITMTWGHGVCQNLFYPLDGSTKSQTLMPMADYADKMLIVAGLDYKMMLEQMHQYDGHFTYPVIYTGTYKNTGGQNCTSTGPSIDQVVSDAIAKTVALPQPLLVISVDGGSASWRGAAQNNTGEGDPKRLFDKLFASVAMPAADVTALRDRRKSVLDFVSGELTGFKQRMGSEDAAKIDAHFESIRQLETQLTATTSVACTTPTVDTASKIFQDKVAAMLDITAMAIRCDITRTVSICWADDGGYRPITLPWLDINSSFHDIAHQGAAGYAVKSKADVWMWEQVARLTKGLNDATEGASTALDNSVIVVGNDMNEGSNHYVGGMPFVLIGSCGGFFKQGQTVKLGNWAKKTDKYWEGDSGVPHNQLLATISNAMDVPVDAFGEGYAGTLDSFLKA
ncbi:MAG TPA: DUF1552 domain-containing protein [Polyangiaceae bacterium]|nr:DUF1552 domain-containing protein [Polyangiaceae bacterium]